MSLHRSSGSRARQTFVAATGLHIGALLALLCPLALVVGSLGCAPDSTQPVERPLAVRVVFPEDTGPDALARAQGPIQEMTARAIELVGEEEIEVDARTVSIGPSDERFQISLSVRPDEYPVDYRIEVEGSGVRETGGRATDEGLLYIGDGMVSLLEESDSELVEVLLVEVVPRVNLEVGSGEVLLTWSAVPGAIGYSVRETIGTEVQEPVVTTSLRMSFQFDTEAERRVYQVSTLLSGDRASAYSEPNDSGGLSGRLDVTVVDSNSGSPLSGALATLGDLQATTDRAGVVRFEDLQPGTYPLRVALEGYIDNTRDVVILEGETTTIQIGLTAPIENGYRIVLTWGQDPHDLDSYLLTPNIEGTVYLINYQNEGSQTEAPYAALDLDDTDGFGPETTTIFQAFEGTYTFYVHNYSGQTGGDLPLVGSGAQVALYKDSTLLTTVTVPSTGGGFYWNVLTLNAVTGAFDVINELADAGGGAPSPIVRDALVTTGAKR